VAWREGDDLGDAMRRSMRLRPPGGERALTVSQEILSRYGYEPYRAHTGEVALRNCPFHALATESPDVVCEINRAFIDGLVRGLGNDSIEVALEPERDRCCVKLRTTSTTRT
jgi:predicted ArsR family transcriptional regulator